MKMGLALRCSDSWVGVPRLHYHQNQVRCSAQRMHLASGCFVDKLPSWCFVVSDSGQYRCFFPLPQMLPFQHKRKAGASETPSLERSASCDWPTYIQISTEGKIQKGLHLYGDIFHWAGCWLLLSYSNMIQREENNIKFHFASCQQKTKLILDICE